MDYNKQRIIRRARRKRGIRKRIMGGPDRPRLTVFRSGRHVYAQVVDDLAGRTLASASTLEKGNRNDRGGNCLAATDVGQRIAERISAQVLQNPIGVHPEHPTYFPDGFAKWADEQRADRPELDAAALHAFGRNMWGGEFVFNVSRDFVRQCSTPALVLPGNDTAHPGVIGLEIAELLLESGAQIDARDKRFSWILRKDARKRLG